MTTSDKHFPAGEGQPTRPDVDALLRTWPPETIQPGQWRVTDAELKAVIGECGRGRFRTVYDAWRRRLSSDHGVVMFRERKVGFFCPTAAEILARTHPTLQGMGRAARKQLGRVHRARPENAVEASMKDHHNLLLNTVTREVRRARTNLLLPDLSAKERPRIPAPEGKGTARSP